MNKKRFYRLFIFCGFIFLLFECSDDVKKEHENKQSFTYVDKKIVQDMNITQEEQVIILDDETRNFQTENSVLTSDNESMILGQDLLYREYTIGHSYPQGQIRIEMSHIKENITGKETILVFQNDKLYAEIAIAESITIPIEKAGYYGFYLEDIHGEWHDISYAVSIFCDVKDDTILLLDEGNNKGKEK